MKTNRSKQIQTVAGSLVVVVWTMTSAWMTSSANAAPTDEKPNIVFIEVDDLTYSYLGCMGNELVRTPKPQQPEQVSPPGAKSQQSALRIVMTTACGSLSGRHRT